MELTIFDKLKIEDIVLEIVLVFPYLVNLVALLNQMHLKDLNKLWLLE